MRGHIAHVFQEDNFDVDKIIGVENKNLYQADELARVAMDNIDSSFRSRVKVGDFLVGGRNFGYGKPHYQAMLAMRTLGVKAVIAESFYHGYIDGEMNSGFPQVACPGIQENSRVGDFLEINYRDATVTNQTSGRVLPFERMSDFELNVLGAGGIVEWLKQRKGLA